MKKLATMMVLTVMCMSFVTNALWAACPPACDTCKDTVQCGACKDHQQFCAVYTDCHWNADCTSCACNYHGITQAC